MKAFIKFSLEIDREKYDLSTYTNHSKATYMSLMNENNNWREIGPYAHTNTTSRPTGYISECFEDEKLSSVSETPERSAEESSSTAKESS